MKKTISLLLALVMCLSLCACGHSHEFTEWSVAEEVSCIADGLKVRTCECGEEETEVIAAHGHSFGAEVEIKVASCVENGSKERTCVTCGYVETETSSATGHIFTAATMFAPKTCTTCGITEGEALAKVITVGDQIEAEDHSFVVESVKFTGSLKDKRGNITYNHSSDYALVIKLDFTNLATDAFDRWFSNRAEEISLEYKGKYRYEGEYWIPADDIVPLANDALYIVYEVPETMGDDTTSAIYATFTIDNETYAVIVQEGDGSENIEKDATNAANVSGDIAKGDVVTNDTTFSFELVDLYYTDKPSYKSGNVTYSYSSKGYCLVCKLDFTNLDSETMTGWNSDRITDMTLTFADSYTYEGVLWIPDNEIVPLDNGYAFILFEVAETVENSADSLVMTFTVDSNKFNINCR